jgi:hypothetical protein
MQEWDIDSFTYQIHAMRSIRAGEEMFISYIEPLLAPRAARREILFSRYAFVCKCSSCGLPPNESKRSDTRRAILAIETPKVWPSYRELLDWIKDLTLPGDYIIERSKKILQMCEDEHIWSMLLEARHVFLIISAYAALGNAAGMAEWAEKEALLLKIYGEHLRQWKMFPSHPQGNPFWMMRARRMTQR